MSNQQNRAIYERFCHEVLVSGNLERLPELVAEDVVSHSPLPGQAPGLPGLRDTLAQFREAFPEMRVAVRDIIADGDKVVGYFSVEGVHQGELFGMPATGKTVAYEEMVIVRLADGKIVEHWSVADTLSMMQTLGAVKEASSEDAAADDGAPAKAQEQSLRTFFDQYAARFNRSLSGEEVDPKEVADSFAPHFVEASPLGVSGGKNGLIFRWMIPRGFAHYKKIGATSMRIADLAIEAIDPLHSLVRVHWDSHYTKKSGGDERIEFDVTYLMHFQRGAPKIFAYITGDEEALLREHGVS